MDEMLKKLLNKEIKPYQLDKLVGYKKATELRRKYLEIKTNTKLEHIKHYSIDEELAIKKNIENMIGAIQIPLGFAGPLKVNGEYAKGEFFIPLATTEGALVASVNRGCSIITKCGGATVRILEDKMTRAPCFKTKSVVDCIKVKEWIIKNFDRIKEVAESTTRHGKLIKIQPILIAGRYIYPRFCYTTGDAMGMNMATIATEEASNFIVEELRKEGIDIELIAVSGNACVDKKPAGINIIEGRGKSVVAEVFLNREEVERYLKTTPERIAEVNRLKNYIGSAISNSLGFNAHYANIVGAIFLATGQDEAHIVEGSLGITIAEVDEDGLYFSVTLPDLPLATIGGGTRVETQRECLEIMGCYGDNKVKKFAEIVGAAVLAGELSLLGALASHHLGKAHQELGR
ncbi:hydroxymethylglutaryl-CoA reductase (NADPH) [Methanocaldococcus indicus]|uniref:hydroxymethylglutaryl-CoA reductase (NADPH) n=1 Tax=Methanocaldococcus indicus TaxID=213231 RepID=UPI003C6CC61C